MQPARGSYGTPSRHVTCTVNSWHWSPSNWRTTGITSVRSPSFSLTMGTAVAARRADRSNLMTIMAQRRERVCPCALRRFAFLWRYRSFNFKCALRSASTLDPTSTPLTLIFYSILFSAALYAFFLLLSLHIVDASTVLVLIFFL